MARSRHGPILSSNQSPCNYSCCNKQCSSLAPSTALGQRGELIDKYMHTHTRGVIIIETSSACAREWLGRSVAFVCRRAVCKCNNFILGSTLTSFILIIHGRAHCRRRTLALLARCPTSREKPQWGCEASTLDTPSTQSALINLIYQSAWLKIINLTVKSTVFFNVPRQYLDLFCWICIICKIAEQTWTWQLIKGYCIGSINTNFRCYTRDLFLKLSMRSAQGKKIWSIYIKI